MLKCPAPQATMHAMGRDHSMFLNSSTLASLRFFAAAARTSSFKQAALELHVTQGAVSQHIKQLEDALGVRLFHRLVRQVALTEEGRRFAAIVARALEELERGAQELTANLPAVDVRLRAGPSLALRWLIPRLGDFYVRHAGVRVFVEAAHGAFDPARREFDLAIESFQGKPPGMSGEPLMDDHLVPVCSPEYLKEHSFLRRPKDLARCTLLHDAQPWIGAARDAEWRYWLDAVGTADVTSDQGQFFSLANMAIEAALRHQGVAMGRTRLIPELLRAGQLIAPLKHRIKGPRSYWLLYHKALTTRPGVQALIRWLHEQAQSSD